MVAISVPFPEPRNRKGTESGLKKTTIHRQTDKSENDKKTKSESDKKTTRQGDKNTKRQKTKTEKRL